MEVIMEVLHLSPNDDIQHILDKLTRPTTIYLRAGEYRNKLWIKRDDVRLVGENRETTVISWDDFARKPHPDGGEYNTFRTYTVCVTGNGCSLENLTVKNGNTDAKKVGQCVALSVNAPLFRARDVDLISEQDTLFTAPFPDDLVVRYSGLTDDPAYYDGFIPRPQLYMQGGSVQIYDNCRIYGNVDFIFGCAEAYFLNCRLISLADKKLIDTVAMDVKNCPSRYAATAGCPVDIDKIRASVEYLLSDNIDYELRTTVVDELHDDKGMLELAEWIKGAKRYFLQNFKDSEAVRFGNLSPCSDEKLRSFTDVMRPLVPSVKIRGEN